MPHWVRGLREPTFRRPLERIGAAQISPTRLKFKPLQQESTLILEKDVAAVVKKSLNAINTRGLLLLSDPAIDSIPIAFIVNGLPYLQFEPARVYVRR